MSADPRLTADLAAIPRDDLIAAIPVVVLPLLRDHPELEVPKSVAAALGAMAAIVGVKADMSAEEGAAAFAAYYATHPVSPRVLDVVRAFLAQAGLAAQEKASTMLGTAKNLKPLDSGRVEGTIPARPWARFMNK